MNTLTSHSASPIQLIRSIKKNRNLIYNLTKRDIASRYRGSAMGILWSLINPLLMLAVYTFVFSIVFKARWPGGTDSHTEFALILFSGLMLFNIFSENINRAPTIVINNVNYVKKVVFPLEILPIVIMGSAMFHYLISLFVWIIFHIILFGIPTPSILQLPLVILPTILMTLGFSWILSSLGVYMRDVAQLTGIATTILLFTTPIFFPLEALPANLKDLAIANPLTAAIEDARNTMIWGKPITWLSWFIYMTASMTIFCIGFAWFQKTRKGFSDVL